MTTLVALSVFVVPLAVADTDVVFEVTDERVAAASGLAADRDRQLYWTVNAGPESDRAMALRTDGSVEGTVRFGENLVDPQAVYYIGSRLYIADIGDADAERDSISVYRFSDPAPVGQQPGTVRRYELTYADGESRDARAMLVGDDGRLFVITHEAEGAIWATDGAPSSNASSELSRVAEAPAWVTDAVFVGQGDIATRSYTSVEVLDGEDYRVIARSPAPFQEKGEGMALSLDGQSLLLNSSGQGQPVVRVDMPNAMAEVPEPGPTPPASPQPSAEPTPTPSATEEPVEEAPAENDRAGEERTGTLVAVLAAAVLAIASGLVVYFAGMGKTTPGPRRAEVATDGPHPKSAPMPEPALQMAAEPPQAEPAQQVAAETSAPDAERQPPTVYPVAGAQLRSGGEDPFANLYERPVPGTPEVASGQGNAAPTALSAPGQGAASTTPPAVPGQGAASTTPSSAHSPGSTASTAPPSVPARATAPTSPPVGPPPVSPEPAPAGGPAAPGQRSGSRSTSANGPTRGSAGSPSITVTENDAVPPARGRRMKPSAVSDPEPDQGIDEQGTWVRPRRSAEERSADLDWLYRR